MSTLLASTSSISALCGGLLPTPSRTLRTTVRIMTAQKSVKTMRTGTESSGSPDGVTKSGTMRVRNEDFGEAIDQRL